MKFAHELHELQTLQEKRAIAAGAKTTTICHILQSFFRLPLYMGSIVTFRWTAAIVLVFCGVLQRQYIEPLQYMYFSGASKTCRNKYSILRGYYSSGIENHRNM